MTLICFWVYIQLLPYIFFLFSGYYCSLGSSTPIPMDNITGNVCPQGQFCLQNSAQGTDCPKGPYLDPVFIMLLYYYAVIISLISVLNKLYLKDLKTYNKSWKKTIRKLFFFWTAVKLLLLFITSPPVLCIINPVIIER